VNSYLIQLELRSALGTPLAADTLWGHIAWGIRYRLGEGALTQWLDRYDAGQPPLVLGDPLAAGFFPRPLLPPVRRTQPPTIDAADRGKRLEKRAWVSHAAWASVCGQVGPARLVEAVAAAAPPEPTEGLLTHASINRLTGGTQQAGAGALFTTRQEYYAQPVTFDVWALSPESQQTVQQWFEDALVGGYGRDAASGLGAMVVLCVQSKTLPAVPDANAGVCLGPVTPARNDPVCGFFSFGFRCGRVGGDFAIGALPDGSSQRQKRPVRCLLRGSVLVQSPPPLFVGRLVHGVHQCPAIRHYAMAPLLPCRLDEPTLADPLLRTPPTVAQEATS